MAESSDTPGKRIEHEDMIGGSAERFINESVAMNSAGTGGINFIVTFLRNILDQPTRDHVPFGADITFVTFNIRLVPSQVAYKGNVSSSSLTSVLLSSLLHHRRRQL